MKNIKRAAILKLILAFISMIILSIIGYFIIKHYIYSSESFRGFVLNNIVIGSILLIILCALQVIIAFIPGELVEIICGYALGGFFGSIICLIGTLLGSVIAILLARKFGKDLVNVIYPREKMLTGKLFKSNTDRNLLTFLVFLIPGTPKDLFTYIVGLTDMKIYVYLLLTAAARYPSIISSTLGGDAIESRNFKLALIIFTITAVIGITGYLIYRTIMSKRNKNNAESERNNEKNS